MKRFRVLVGIAASIACLLVAATAVNAATSATSPASGTISWIDVGPEQTSVVQVVPQNDGKKASVFFYGENTLGVSEYDASAKTLSPESIIASPAVCLPQALFTDRDSSGDVWVAFNSSLVKYVPTTRQSTVVALPQPDNPVPSDPSSLSDLQSEMWDLKPVSGMAVDASDTVWVTRQFSHSLTRFNPSSKSFQQSGLPNTMESGGRVVSVGRGVVRVEQGLRTSSLLPSGPLAATLSVGSGQWTADQAGSTLSRAPLGTPLVASGTSMIASLTPAAPVSSFLVTVGKGDDIWYVNGDNNLVVSNASSGETKVYPLPQVTFRGHAARPYFFSATVDDSGNLWFSYGDFFQKAGVALR